MLAHLNSLTDGKSIKTFHKIILDSRKVVVYSTPHWRLALKEPVEKVGLTTEAMTELRKLFPTAKLELTFGETVQGSEYVRIRTECTERYTSVVVRATLSEAMAVKRLEATTGDIAQ